MIYYAALFLAGTFALVAEQPIQSASVMVKSKPLLRLYSGLGELSVQERAQIVSDRIARLLDRNASPELVMEHTPEGTLISHERGKIVLITPADSAPLKKNHDDLAKEYASLISNQLAAGSTADDTAVIVGFVLLVGVALSGFLQIMRVFKKKE